MLLAYIDPGSGSMLIQAILAGVLAVPLLLRRTAGDAWRRLRGQRHRAPGDDRRRSDSNP